MAREPEAGNMKTPLLALLVVVTTIGAIMMLSGGRTEESIVEESPEDAVLEISPVIPGGAIKSASWRTDGEHAARDDEAHEDDDGSILDKVEWSDDDAGKFDKSLEETIDQIHGLGVYVERDDDEKKADTPRK